MGTGTGTGMNWEVYRRFWRKNPGLLIGLTFFLGILFALETPWSLVAALVIFPTLGAKKIGLACFIFLLPLLLFHQFYFFPDPGKTVSGIFSIKTMGTSKGFVQGWRYRGVLKTSAGKFPCQIRSKTPLESNILYKVTGVVSKSGRSYFIRTHSPPEPVGRGVNLAAWRYRSQEKVKNYIHSRIPQERAAHFLSGVLTGQMEDDLLSKEFGTLGLSHILAISGFHFAIIAFVFQYFFLFFLSPKIKALSLIVLLTIYMFFIGFAPSVGRAWVMSVLFFLGTLLEKRSFSLNSMGCAAIFILCIDPLAALNLGFQLSFLATAALLLLYRPFSRLLTLWIPKYPLEKVIQKSLLWQHAYLLLAFFREAVTVICCVHVVLFPLLLFIFQNFSINSLFYNLFFPLLATLSMMLFLLGIVLGQWMHTLNGWYSDWMLRMTESPPLAFQSLEVASFPTPLLLFSLLFFLFIGIHAHK